MDPSDLDGEDGGLSFNELPPSVRQRMQAQPQTAARPAYQPAPQQVPRYAMGGPIPVEQYQAQTAVQQLGPAATSAYQFVPPNVPDLVHDNLPPGLRVRLPQEKPDNSPWLFLGATALLAGIGYWAYSKMEKEKKGRPGPPQLGEGRYKYDGPEEGYDDDPESDGPLDAYENVGLPARAVDPHEKGGIKLVKG